MANILPSVLFPNMTSDGTSITIPLTDLPALTSAEADPATGDGREVARAIVEQVVSQVSALDANNAPTEMIVTKANPIGQGEDTVRQSYTLAFDISYDASGVSMVAEA
ncbi:hypothetical protein VKI21_06835 [Cyanobacterium aponinum UTEX 3222]|uniref:hypothetical protein n=1 Tax=Cyanobacterium aponinum TaxID=379064 RepID=UPI003090AE95|nr:hypothetical protein VKI21_06835 [Cyanobacterium aponinum UTEX 3222]